MSKRWFPFISLVSLSGSLLFTLNGAIAAPMPLTQATLRKVVKDVKIFLGQQPSRTAQINDRLGSGDALKTARASRAELKFNDGTLAKVGEYATFRFTPNTRRFDLQNGTYLFLVPPGRGNTEFYTPNARAGVRGSALFLRYDAETDTTTMGALTNNTLGPMDITVGDQKQDLYAGQMAVVIKNKIDRIETFDLRTFYNTSALFKDVDLSDPEVRAVRLEISEALQLQGVLQNGSASSQTPTNLNPSTAAPSMIPPIVVPTQPVIDPSIAGLREPLVVKAPPIPSIIKTIPTPFPTGNSVNPIENPIPIVSRPIREIPTLTTPISDPIETATPTEATPIVKAEPTPVKAEPISVKAEPLPLKVESALIKVEPKPLQTEPIATKGEPKTIGPSVNLKDHHHHHNSVKIITPKIDVKFSTPKTNVKIETPKIEIVIEHTKTNSGNPDIRTIEIPKFDVPKITETPKVDSPGVNSRPEITLDVPIKVVPLQTPVNPISTPQSEAIRTAPDIAIPTPQTIVTPIVIPVATPVASPIVRPFTQPTVLKDMPIMKPTIVEPILTPVVIPVTPMMPVKVIPVTPITPIVSPTVVTPPPTVITPPPTVIAPSPTVVNPIPTIVTPLPTVITPSPTVVTLPPTVITPPPTVVTPIPTVITPTVVTPTVTPTPRPVVVPVITTPENKSLKSFKQ